MAAKVVCVVGPTACGKTKLGVLLAKGFGGEVVSADSMQIYRGMTIGTAAPTPEEMDGIPQFEYVFAGGLDIDPAKAPELLEASCALARRLAESL